MTLARTRLALRRIKAGYPQQFVIACIGDSWTCGAERYVRDFTRALVAEYGSAGPGYVGLYMDSDSNPSGNADPDLVTLAYSGTWSTQPSVVASPDVGVTCSSEPGAKIAVTYTGAQDVTAARLFYVASEGQLRYRYNDGEWQLPTTSEASGAAFLSLQPPPAGAWTLELENVWGNTYLCGLDLMGSGSGVTVHKLGRGGASTNHWYSVDAVQWQAGIASLAPQLVINCFGTNDQVSTTLSSFFARYHGVVVRERAALPMADLMVVAPCENFAERPEPMTRFSIVARAVADLNGAAFLDLQAVFPPSYADLMPDDIHPGAGTGGLLMADALLRELT